VPDGVRLPHLERELAELGGALLVAVLEDLAAAAARAVPQDDRLATTAPPPTTGDYAVSTDRPARWAYNFARAVAPLGGPLRLRVTETGAEFPLHDALDWDPDGRVPAPVVIEGDRLAAQFRPGVARFRLASETVKPAETLAGAVDSREPPVR
jgi:hypothetical protein